MDSQQPDDFLDDGLVWSSDESDYENDLPVAPVVTSLPKEERSVIAHCSDNFLNMDAFDDDWSKKRKADFDTSTSYLSKKISIWSYGVLPLDALVVAKLPGAERFQLSVVAGDGDCFFSSVALALQEDHQQSYTAQTLRERAIAYIYSNLEQYQPYFDEQEDVFDYLSNMQKKGTWADARVMKALVDALQVRIEIVDISGQYVNSPVLYEMISDVTNASTVTIRLQRSGRILNEHYDAITRIRSDALSQPILR